jgi:hypothetical protein
LYKAARMQRFFLLLFGVCMAAACASFERCALRLPASGFAGSRFTLARSGPVCAAAGKG